jgi:hypothetical protein
VAGGITYRRVATALLLAITLFAAALLVYGACLRATAKALIKSAREIRSTADAEREIASWRGRRLTNFYEEPTLPPDLGGDKVYAVQVPNTALSRLRLVRPAWVGMAIRFRSGVWQLDAAP